MYTPPRRLHWNRFKKREKKTRNPYTIENIPQMKKINKTVGHDNTHVIMRCAVAAHIVGIEQSKAKKIWFCLENNENKIAVFSNSFA